jgi:cystathionine beta-synthase
MNIYRNVLEMVGNTPLLELQKLDAGPCRLFAKLELLNPGGSIKDRIGVAMIEAAEKRGELKPGDTIVEATAGNTGIGLALAAAQKGYHLVLVIPDKMSQEKIFNLRSMGAEIILTRSDVARGHPEYYQDLAQSYAREHGAYYINQFGNPDNPKAHETTTAPEIWEQMDRPNAIVVGVAREHDLGASAFSDARAQGRNRARRPEDSVLANCAQGSSREGAWLVRGHRRRFPAAPISPR